MYLCEYIYKGIVYFAESFENYVASIMTLHF